jgi:hypothetical protein
MSELGHEEKSLPGTPKACFIFKKWTFALNVPMSQTRG